MALLENVENKIRLIKMQGLFDIDDLDDEIRRAIDGRDIAGLKDVHYNLMERYVALNSNKVLKACYFNLIYDGIFAKYPEDLVKKSIEAINDDDNHLLLDIVMELYELDERNQHM